MRVRIVAVSSGSALMPYHPCPYRAARRSAAAEWGRFWLVPAGYMMVVLVIFWFYFRDDREKAAVEGK